MKIVSGPFLRRDMRAEPFTVRVKHATETRLLMRIAPQNMWCSWCAYNEADDVSNVSSYVHILIFSSEAKIATFTKSISDHCHCVLGMTAKTGARRLCDLECIDLETAIKPYPKTQNTCDTTNTEQRCWR